MRKITARTAIAFTFVPHLLVAQMWREKYYDPYKENPTWSDVLEARDVAFRERASSSDFLDEHWRNAQQAEEDASRLESRMMENERRKREEDARRVKECASAYNAIAQKSLAELDKREPAPQDFQNKATFVDEYVRWACIKQREIQFWEDPYHTKKGISRDKMTLFYQEAGMKWNKFRQANEEQNNQEAIQSNIPSSNGRTVPQEPAMQAYYRFIGNGSYLYLMDKAKACASYLDAYAKYMNTKNCRWDRNMVRKEFEEYMKECDEGWYSEKEPDPKLYKDFWTFQKHYTNFLLEQTFNIKGGHNLYKRYRYNSYKKIEAIKKQGAAEAQLKWRQCKPWL